MAYQKMLIDNVTCSRRFHVTFDDSDQPLPQVSVDCPFCGVRLFEKQNHPPVNLARQENLVTTAALSDDLVRECRFKV